MRGSQGMRCIGDEVVWLSTKKGTWLRGLDRSEKSNENVGMKLTAAFKQEGEWWAAWIEEIPEIS